MYRYLMGGAQHHQMQDAENSKCTMKLFVDISEVRAVQNTLGPFQQYIG